MRMLIVLLIIAAMFQPKLASGGLGLIRGSEADIWTIDRTSVIVATLKEVRPHNDNFQSHGTHYATLVPSATVCGTFDASLHPILPVRLWIGSPGSSVQQVLPEGTTVLVVIQQREDHYLIVPDICPFMPGGRSSVAVIDGLDDPQVNETLRRLQDARADPPTTAPATREAAEQ